MRRLENIQLNKEDGEYDRARAPHRNTDQHSCRPSALSVQIGHSRSQIRSPALALFLPMTPCNAATSSILLKCNPPCKHTPLPSFPQLPIKPSDTSRTLQRNTLFFFPFLQYHNSSTVHLSPVTRGEESWLTGASIHTPKSAKASLWHRQKKKKKKKDSRNAARAVQHFICEGKTKEGLLNTPTVFTFTGEQCL